MRYGPVRPCGRAGPGRCVITCNVLDPAILNTGTAMLANDTRAATGHIP
jgi:hypothetical protein